MSDHLQELIAQLEKDVEFHRHKVETIGEALAVLRKLEGYGVRPQPVRATDERGVQRPTAERPAVVAGGKRWAAQRMVWAAIEKCGETFTGEEVAFKGGLKDGARAITEKLRFWLKFGWTAVVRAGVPGTPSVYRRGLKWREFAGQFEGNAQRATEETRTEHGRNTDKPSAVHGKPLTPALSPKRGEGEECGARKKKRQARAPLGVCRYCGKGLFQQRSLDKGHCSNSKCVRQAQEVPSEGRGSNGFTPRGIEALPTGGNYTPKGKTSALAEAVLALFSREKAPVGVLEIEEQIKTAHPELMQTQQHATNLRVCLIDLSNAGKLVRLGHGAGAFYRASVEVADEESHG